MRLGISLIGLSYLFTSVNVGATEPRIIRGSPAKPDEGPWMAALVYANKTAEDGQYCGGTLVAPTWVLSAGHCTEKTIGQDFLPKEVVAVLGTHLLSKESEAERIPIVQIIRHPNYDGADPNRPPTSDIALFKLKYASKQPILQVAEYYYNNLTEVGLKATVMGWGSTSSTANIYPDELRQAPVPIVSQPLCNGQRSYPGLIKDTMICAGYMQGGIDSCVGDSGGPLLVNTSNGWRQVGIVSYGEGCALPNYYGVYTRVPSFQDFITQHICSAATTPEAPTVTTSVNGTTATVTWSEVTEAQGYQFYYAIYTSPLNDLTLDSIHSFDMGTETQLTAILNEGTQYYVAVRAYQGNCYGPYSNLGEVLIPSQ